MADTQVIPVDNKVKAQRAKKCLEAIGVEADYVYGKNGVTGLKLSIPECVELVRKMDDCDE